MTYQIANWAESYETSDTRKLKHLDWVKLSNKINGDLYLCLVGDHPDGPLHWAAWCAILQVASLCRTRGVLVQDNGEPHTAQSLARKTRLPVGWFVGALPRLVEVGWMECDEKQKSQVVESAQDRNHTKESPDNLPPSPDMPGDFPEVPGDFPEEAGKNRGQNRIELEREREQTHKGRALENATGSADAPGGRGPLLVGPQNRNGPGPALLTEEEFSAFRELCRGSGAPIAACDADWEEARFPWGRLDPEQRMQAVDGIQRRIDAGVTDDSVMRMLPQNYLKARKWDRPIIGARPAKHGLAAMAAAAREMGPG